MEGKRKWKWGCVKVREDRQIFLSLYKLLVSTVATQGWSPIIGQLWWLNFLQIFPILGKGTTYRASTISALTSDGRLGNFIALAIHHYREF